MSEGKSHAAASVHPELGLVVTGGFPNSHLNVDTVEATTDGVNFVRLPSLPERRHAHCQLTIDR